MIQADGTTDVMNRMIAEEVSGTQYDEEFPSVKVDVLNIRQRSAFDMNPAMSLNEWKMIADEVAQSNPRKNAHKRISPSYQHLEILHTLQKLTTRTRQLHFSNSTCIDSLYFCRNASGIMEIDDEDENDSLDRVEGISLTEEDTEVTRKKSELIKSYQRRRHRGFRGQYRSINPAKAILLAIPDNIVAPILSHKKHRLPNRADVGFPAASEEDIQRKHNEIQWESHWEETSPRVVLPVSSDDLGVSIDEIESNNSLQPEHLKFNGGGLPGLPYAGRELQLAKYRHNHFFKRKLNVKSQPISKTTTYHLRPNPYSMLAPPMEALYSESQGWKPRLYHDRTPGMSYVLVCPLDIQFPDLKETESYLGRLTLYKLPNDGNLCGLHGKISESFWFPFGNWDRHVLDKTEGLDAACPKKDRKAVFSFDPFDFIPSFENTNNETDAILATSLYVAIEVFDLIDGASKETASIAITHPIHSSFDDFPFSQLLRLRSYGVGEVLSCLDIQRELNEAYVVHEVEGYAKENQIEWPAGVKRKIKLYPCTDQLRSQEKFVDGLSRLVLLNNSEDMADVEFAFPLGNRELEIESCDISRVGSTASAMKKNRTFLGGRLVPARNKNIGSNDAGDKLIAQSNQQSIGVAEMCCSSLKNDFLQSLLIPPSELGFVDNKPESETSSLFVDVSGDFAVFLERRKMEMSRNTVPPCRKSELQRLPRATSQGGYAATSEFRELLHTPIRPAKQYDVDVPGSYRSLLNLLFLYPRLLRCVDGTTSSTRLPTLRTPLIRISITKKELDINEGTGVVKQVHAFYNHAPWIGQSLLSSFFTTIDVAETRTTTTNRISREFPMRDEAKIRLPLVLDGTYSLHFMLYDSSMTSDDSASLTLVAEAAIPLSSSTSRDAMGGSRVSTIIPNGKHRVELGLFQLQFETRLVSSVHVGDPAVAALIRDFPNTSFNGSQSLLRKFDSSFTSTLVPSPSTSSSVELDKAVPSLMPFVNENSFLNNFHLLLHLQLSQLVTPSLEQKKSPQFMQMIQALSGLFDLITKARTGMRPNFRFVSLIKSYMDVFDEDIFSETDLPIESPKPIKDTADNPSLVKTTSLEDGEKEVELENVEEASYNNGLLANRHSQLKRRQHHDLRLRRSVASLTAVGNPLSRIPYGATKADRMREEAERSLDSNRISQYFDDDETVVTSLSLVHWNSERPNVAEQSSKLAQEVTSVGQQIVRSYSIASEPKYESNNEDIDFAKRMKNVAQIMLAPCVGQSLSNVIATEIPMKNGKLRKEPQLTFDTSFSNQDFAGNRTDSPAAGSGIHKSGESRSPLLRDAGRYKIVSSTLDYVSPEKVRVAVASHLYETLFSMWLLSYRHFVCDLKGGAPDLLVLRLSTRKLSSLFAADNDKKNEDGTQLVQLPAFFSNLEFVLPLCLKSFILRCTAISVSHQLPLKVLLDENSMIVFEMIVNVVGQGLLVRSYSDTQATTKKNLLTSLDMQLTFVDFMVGIGGVIHPNQFSILLESFLRCFHYGAKEAGESPDERIDMDFSNVIARCQLILSFVEKIAVLPGFVSLNFMSDFVGNDERKVLAPIDWLHQYYGESSICMTRNEIVLLQLPLSGWLADIIVNECFLVCSLSFRTFITEAIAQVGNGQHDSTFKLRKDDFLDLQSTSIHAMSILYELIIRRYALDCRYQSQQYRERIAAMFCKSVLQHSVGNVKWLAKVESNHKVRSLWLQCVLYVLQESPESTVRDYVRSCFDPEEATVLPFLRLLRLCCSTSQTYNEAHQQSPEISILNAPSVEIWILQESLNTICAIINIVVTEIDLSASTDDRKRIMRSVLDLLLFAMSFPQSPVTQLRALGGSLYALETFGINDFVEAAGSTFQHWIRIVLSMMNCISLSVRSIAVDFTVSILGSFFDSNGSIEIILQIFATVLPEVAAREIALYSVNGLINEFYDIPKALWPLRRAIADLADSDPIDDDRVDTQLAPALSSFCRICQAIIDGVLIEIRMHGDNVCIAGQVLEKPDEIEFVFDANEESLLEAATFFVPEQSPLQRLRWLLTLKSLHERNGQMIEAGETLFLCAETILQSLSHIYLVWIPTHFTLWNDSSRATSLDSGGEEIRQLERGNSAVMQFAHEYLQPKTFLGIKFHSRVDQNMISRMYSLLAATVTACYESYMHEECAIGIAYNRIQRLLQSVMSLNDRHGYQDVRRGSKRDNASRMRVRNTDSRASLQQTIIILSRYVGELAERSLRLWDNLPSMKYGFPITYVMVKISGIKPQRLEESTGVPFFLEWEKPCICRLPSKTVKEYVTNNGTGTIDRIQLCEMFAKLFVTALQKECGIDKVLLRTDDKVAIHAGCTILDVFPAEAVPVDIRDYSILDPTRGMKCKHFMYKADRTLTENTVARDFPCVLSRQRSMITTKISSAKMF